MSSIEASGLASKQSSTRSGGGHGDPAHFNRRVHSHHSTSSQVSNIESRKQVTIMLQNSSSSMASTSSHQPHSTSSPTSTGAVALPNGITPPGAQALNFHLARVGLDTSLQQASAASSAAATSSAASGDTNAVGSPTSGANYKCIKMENGDRMPTLIERALEKHLLPVEDRAEYCLVQLLPDGGKLAAAHFMLVPAKRSCFRRASSS